MAPPEKRSRLEDMEVDEPAWTPPAKRVRFFEATPPSVAVDPTFCISAEEVQAAFAPTCMQEPLQAWLGRLNAGRPPPNKPAEDKKLPAGPEPPAKLTTITRYGGLRTALPKPAPLAIGKKPKAKAKAKAKPPPMCEEKAKTAARAKARAEAEAAARLAGKATSKPKVGPPPGTVDIPGLTKALQLKPQEESLLMVAFGKRLRQRFEKEPIAMVKYKRGQGFFEGTYPAIRETPETLQYVRSVLSNARAAVRAEKELLANIR